MVVPHHSAYDASVSTAEVGGDPDALLIAAAQVDRRAFEPLYLKYVDMVFRYCLRRLDDRDAAADATSQIFEKVLIGLPHYRPDRSTFRSWLFTVAHNALVDLNRSSRPGIDLDHASTLIDPEPGPEDRALSSEDRREVQRLLEAVPVDQRRVLELRFAGLMTPEIARTLSCSEGAVRARQYRGINRLRLVLGLTPDNEGGDRA